MMRNANPLNATMRLQMTQVIQPMQSQFDRRLETLKVLIVDDEPTMRKVTRSLLQAIGVKSIFEAHSGRHGLETICVRGPDVVILDWEMPTPNGPDFMRQVRSPGTFPLPDVPVIMLTGHGERSRVVEAVRLGVNEFLLKPVSSTALRARLISILAHPRRMVRQGDYYGPEPRKISSYKPECDPALGNVVLL
jgi:two-component system, chemotaxis family, chemotaxis protein CheY